MIKLKPVTLSVTPKMTVFEVMVSNSVIFKQMLKRLISALRARASVDFVEYAKCKPWTPKKRRPKIQIKGYDNITMRDLSDAQEASKSDEHFFVVMEFMTGLKRSEIMRLTFLRTFKAYIDIVDKIGEINKSWSTLTMPLTKEEKASKIERPDRGFLPMVHAYSKLMGVTPEEGWRTSWAEVYVAFETQRDTNLEQRRYNDIIKRQQKKPRR